MITVTQMQYIKELREREGVSISEIARRLNVSWVTARKYADGDLPVAGGPKTTRGTRLIEPYMEYVQGWIEEDCRRHRKQRRTARVIFEHLKVLGFDGSARTVRDAVRDQRVSYAKQLSMRDQQFVRLEHPCGEAQVDFGEFDAIDRRSEKVVRLSHLVMSFPHSNARFSRVLPAQNSECLFTGLISMFDEVGGVPPYILFDNLTPVVKKIVSRTQRELTEMFKHFSYHYRFQYMFCQPACGWEKGNVEGAVGYVRRNFLTPLKVIDDYDTINEQLIASLREDRKQDHYEKQQPCATLFLDDQAVFYSLPETPFKAIQIVVRTLNRYGETKVDGETYHVPQGYPKQRVYIELHWDRVRVLDEHGSQEITTLPRRYGLQTEDIDWVAELEIYRFKPRAIEQATYLQALPEEIRTFLLPPALEDRRERVATVITLLQDHALADVTRVIQQALAYGVTDLGSLMMLVGSCTQPERPAPLLECSTPPEASAWKPDLSTYDALTPGGERKDEQIDGLV